MNNNNDLIKNRENFWKEIKDDYYLNNTNNSMQRKKWFAKVVKIYNPKSVLEIGCNEGVNLREIHKIDPRIKLAGIDIHEHAIKYAKKTLPNSTLICGSII